jgi:hypothetical protein
MVGGGRVLKSQPRNSFIAAVGTVALTASSFVLTNNPPAR